MNMSGALPCQEIQKLLAGEYIIGADPDNVQPASLDLRLSDEVYRLPAVPLTTQGESVQSMIQRVGGQRHDLGSVFESGTVYIARLEESCALSEQVRAYANPKSTTGRLDIHVRLLADGAGMYDTIPRGYRGGLWLIIVPGSFSVRLEVGYALAQVRLFFGDSRLDALALEMLHQESPLIWSGVDPVSHERLKLSHRDNALGLSVDIRESAVVGWEALPCGEVIDVGKKNHYDPKTFFRPVIVGSNGLHLYRKKFYILSTAEHVRIPQDYACEMRPGDSRMGEFRAHYAGFIDPGWGVGKNGEGQGRRLTLEVRTSEDVIVAPEQTFAQVRLEKTRGTPEVSYDDGGTYVDQDMARLAKQFKPWTE